MFVVRGPNVFSVEHNQSKTDVRSLCVVRSTTSMQSMLELGGLGYTPGKF